MFAHTHKHSNILLCVCVCVIVCVVVMVMATTVAITHTTIKSYYYSPCKGKKPLHCTSLTVCIHLQCNNKKQVNE